MHTIPSSVYRWQKAAGCGVARGRGGSGVGKIDPPPKHNSRPEENSFLDRQRKKKLPIRESPLLAGKGDEVFIPAGVAPDAREAALGKAAAEKAFDGLRDDPPQWAVCPFETVFVFPGEAVEKLVKNGVE